MPARPAASDVRRRLLRWFRRNARELPWRRTRDPYAVLVSEFMLQQTRVEAVMPYYRRFLKTFPTLASLAEASEQQVLSNWQGLGYYSRAKRLHAIARSGQGIPRTFAALQNLPGVGKYTAGAVASIAFGEPVPAVDGNADRVLRRLFGVPAALKGQVTDLAWSLVRGSRNPGGVNQALMDLGASICKPKCPACTSCPMRTICQAAKHPAVPDLPAKQQPSVELCHVCVVPWHSGRFGLRKIEEGNWWRGMWEFPREQLVAGESPSSGLHRIGALKVTELGKHRHAVTKHKITLHAYITPEQLPRLEWFEPNTLSSIPMPAPQRVVLTMATERLALK